MEKKAAVKATEAVKAAGDAQVPTAAQQARFAFRPRDKHLRWGKCTVCRTGVLEPKMKALFFLGCNMLPVRVCKHCGASFND